MTRKLNDDEMRERVDRVAAGYKMREEEYQTIRADVTADDIRDGIRDDPCNCPLALAISRKLNGPEVCVLDHGYRTVYVTAAFMQIAGGAKGEGLHECPQITLPDEARAWVDAFDRGDEVEPIQFEFVAPGVTI